MSAVRIERQGVIGRLTLARAEARNVIDRQMAEDLFAGLQRLESDNQVRVVHLTGEGEDFCAGVDLDAMSRLGAESGDAPSIRVAAYNARLASDVGLQAPQTVAMRR